MDDNTSLMSRIGTALTGSSSEDTETTTDTTAAPPPAPAAAPVAKKHRIATTSFAGPLGKFQFNTDLGGVVLEVDAAKIPDSIRDVVTAYGAVSIIQGAYGNADPENIVAVARDMLDRLYTGRWTPGPSRSEKEPDDLHVVLAEHLNKPIDYVVETYIPKYMTKNGFVGRVGLGQARKRLAGHPDIAPKIAKLVSERAKRAADAAKKAPRESLDL